MKNCVYGLKNFYSFHSVVRHLYSSRIGNAGSIPVKRIVRNDVKH